jgi:hypothetical protein
VLKTLNEAVSELLHQLDARDITIFNNDRELRVLRAKSLRADLESEPAMLEASKLSDIECVDDEQMDPKSIAVQQINELYDQPIFSEDQNKQSTDLDLDSNKDDEVSFLIETNENYRLQLDSINKTLNELTENNIKLKENEEILNNKVNDLTEKVTFSMASYKKI